ncbi:hypothetical protein AQUCO_00201435v1 [Aquilegia coerulea]|uniref:Myb-like domain-containing protein n=3 Tax=Aquilegia coerulea TaxID=218851 RepID=A0A2G5F820_AQUCA|nr:hypothetical protein AQUCO_00201435v1 [Aquilegia coerulea]PIA64139.1 hypothetical protein AQUCO_00201435v1 [Aquilegia coerulea]
MAADSNMVFNNDMILASGMNSRAISFQSGSMNGESGMIPFGNSSGINNTAGIIFSGNSNKVNDTRGRGRSATGNSSASSHLFESVPGIKQDAGFAAEWSVEEQAKLEEGLVKYANEPNVMRYVKIAASLRDKAVRDVALRCRWMTNESGKRRKQEHYSGRKMKDKRETLLESSLKANTTPVQPHNMATYSLMMHHMDPNNTLSSEAVSNTTRHLLDENVKVFGQITSNFSTYKIQDNIDLLCRTRKNIADILKEMREVPGIMSQMPPLPVSINEELADAFLPSTYQAIFGLPREIHLKQEPRC